VEREYLDSFYATKCAYDYLFCFMDDVRCAFSDTFGGLVGVSRNFMDVSGVLIRVLLKRGLNGS
jgi:hypothetical protein